MQLLGYIKPPEDLQLFDFEVFKIVSQLPLVSPLTEGLCLQQLAICGFKLFIALLSKPWHGFQ